MHFPDGIPDHPIPHHERSVSTKLLACVASVASWLYRYFGHVKIGVLLICSLYVVLEQTGLVEFLAKIK